jgi:hypothetical protein
VPIRDRLLNIGRRAANTVLDRVESRFVVQSGPSIASPASATSEIVKAQERMPELGTDEDPKSLFVDPYAMLEQMGFREKPNNITFQTIKLMRFRLPIASAIIQRRLAQLSAFTQPQSDQFSMGFTHKLRDPKAKVTRGAQKHIDKMDRAMLETGFVSNHRGRANFETFTRKYMADSLTYDAGAIETVPNRKGLPAEWYAVDASTMRIADTGKTYPDDSDTESPKYVQIYDNVVIEQFTESELAYGVRNPSTDIRSYGYGVSELELGVSVVTSLLWGLEYNQSIFHQGTLQKGLLNLKGTLNQVQLKAFRRMWYQLVSGVSNAHRLPILNAQDGVEWVPLQNSNKDMEYNAYIDFMLKVFCSLYLMDPIEINFKYGPSEGRSMFEGANKARLVESKDVGLKPLLRFYANELNRAIVWPIDPDFSLGFMGLNASTPDELAKLNQQRVTTTHTINEIRQEQGLEAREDGDVILNAVWLQAKQAEQQAAMMQQQGGTPGGMPGQPGQPGPTGPGPGSPTPPNQEEDTPGGPAKAPGERPVDEEMMATVLDEFAEAEGPEEAMKSLIRFSV